MSVKPYSRARPPEENEPPLRRWSVRVGGERGDRAADEARGLGDRPEVRVAALAVAPGGLGDAVDVEHHLRAHPARRQRDRGAAVRRELLGLREREPEHRRLGQVVEGREAVVRGVVLERAVGHLDDEAARPADQQRQREVAGDQVRVDREAQQPQAAVEVVLPHRRVPLGQLLAAPDVVDEDVEAALLGVDARDERRRPGRGRGGRPRPRCPWPPAASTSSAVSSIVSGRSYSERRSRVERPVQ